MSQNIEHKPVQDLTVQKVTWKGWASLIFLIVCFSGVFSHEDNFLRAFDFMALLGDFGHAEGAKVSLQGTGGSGAREAFLVALTMVPTTMVAQGLIEVCQHLGAITAAGRLFQPFFKRLLGVPGVVGLAFVSGFTSSDVAAFMTKNMADEKLINDDHRTIFAAYQYAGSATINNTIGSGAALLPISVLPVGIIIGLIVVVKFIGANFVRAYLRYYHRKHPEAE